MPRTAIGVGLVVLSTACAKGTTNVASTVTPQAAAAARQGCQAVDTSFALGTPVFTECGVERQATVQGRQPTMDFTPRPPVRDCYTVAVAVVVDERGVPVPTTVRVVRSNDSQFAQAFVNTLPSWRFTPAVKDGLPVKQLVEIGQTAGVRTVRSGRPMMPPASSSPRC